MIANIMTIFYVLTVTDEIINSGTLQRGAAISRVDEDDGYQVYKYSNYLTSTFDSSDDIETAPFEEKKMYLITGKFSVSQDDSINVTIISNVHIPLDEEDIPVMKPTVNFVGKTMNYAQLTDVGYTLQIQVKPYLSKEQFNPFLVNLTHPVNGRFKNALTKAKKNSTIHTTGLFFLADKQLHCEILEFQFIAGKIESESTISVPWKSKTDTTPSSSKTKSTIERRINNIRQNLETKTPPSSPLANTPKKGRGGRKTSTTKISEISKSLLSQNQDIEMIDSENDNEEIEGIGENIVEEDNEKDDAPENIPTKPKRPKRARK
ncbi:unnamed protein product [Rhizophagus irregularis]|uniref:Uncharacterized protein n=1 Tax=Rhizophagus irregularis TaxID=588596 RepID=A0A2I1HTX7_9GLOM|nr:hypothetical protein RhiirA4_526549 [Rhizophagus irregularis]PKY62451.1 hypothetical protein RhiirA4_527117 [Rhizophagus irregularis]CAB4404263.1 unnamed protein product [Rhizophagus irregularis]CAB4439191.1 unnamed protein product [Rhizophagus irregularis]